MTTAWVVRLGTGGSNVDELVEAGYLGVDFVQDHDIRDHLGQGPEAFRKAMIPVTIGLHRGMSKIVAAQAMGSLHAAAETMAVGDLVLAPTASPIRYHFGIVTSDYEFHPRKVLPHRRRVDWRGSFDRSLMSPRLASAAGTPQTIKKLSPEHAPELVRLTRLTEIGSPPASFTHAGSAEAPTLAPAGEVIPSDVQDPLAFQMEKQLEDFLVHNWSRTALGRDYDIFSTEDEGDIGRQFKTDIGLMDILAISKDRTRLLVVELKRGRASDVVVGQIQRYMGYAKAILAEPGQSVEGVIIAQEDDAKIRYALSVAANIRFLRYRVEFHLEE
ncbi:endonuclease NucS domain-containing protein [Arthrobacter zhaoguopingii]|uniref:endonuclease NucS domain-containing protein n=1 Tax=Arthrobacter zhaoguopingii TaxID=2681491 RepID=UPI001915440E|nr:endonuclease NucS domain-containing protein [Arthrobacter zhaoguopingii]